MKRHTSIAFAITAGMAAALAATIAVRASYRRAMRAASMRVDGSSQLTPSPYGDIEFSVGGSGSPVLVIHGSGGGFDQGELMVRAVLGDRYRWICPSRFGYLRSTFHAGATFEDQAHAYAWLLDQLHLDRVAVVALSHGGPSALFFAALHPARVTSLTLISAGVASSDDAAQRRASRQGDALTWLFQRDYRYWAMTSACRRQFLQVMGASGEVIERLTPDARRLADEVIDGMNPVSRRAAGVRFDNQAALPNERIADIRAPTLVVHAKDDTLQRFRNAEFAAAMIPGARLVSFERGGHLVMAVEQAAIQALVQRHIDDGMSQPSRNGGEPSGEMATAAAADGTQPDAGAAAAAGTQSAHSLRDSS